MNISLKNVEARKGKNNKNFKYDNIEVDLKKDQEICQVIKEPFAGKGPRSQQK